MQDEKNRGNQRVITQIGSLPYDNVRDAVDYSMQHDIPFLPELPLLGDAMLEYIKRPGTMSCLEEFSKRIRGRDVVKIQCIGPATLILGGYSESEAFERAYAHIDSIIGKLEAKEVILFLDEPALGHAGFDYQTLWDGLFGSFNFGSFDVIAGVHTCGNMDWDRMLDSNINIISFDASQYNFTNYPKYKDNRINGERHKRIAWGIKDKKDVKDYQEGDLLTLPCGMGPKVYEVKDCPVELENLVNARDLLLGKKGD
jgi:hypothetical protein